MAIDKMNTICISLYKKQRLFPLTLYIKTNRIFFANWIISMLFPVKKDSPVPACRATL